jgi:ribonuclease III
VNCQKLPKNSNKLSSSLDYSFKKQELLFEALRHPSYVYEMDSQGISDNQRLEFLGDAVINLVVSHLLMGSFPEMKEGDLSKCRASLVSENGLHSIAQKLKLGDYIFLGKGEELTNGRKKSSILSDAIEALIGAIYLDGGFDNAFRVAANLFSPFLNEIDLNKSINDFKTELQEYAQEVFRLTPEYKLEKETGPDHDKTFYAVVYLRKKVMGRGNGKSKKEAEQKAAQEALACLKK